MSADFATKLERALPHLLADGALPEDWSPRATTYDLPRFDSPEAFAERIDRALSKIVSDNITDPATLRDALYNCGLPYDYARLGQPLSTLYELYLQAKSGAARAFTFASATKPWLAVIEAPNRRFPARVYAEGSLPISDAKRAALREEGVDLHEHWAAALPESDPGILTIVVLEKRFSGAIQMLAADAVCYAVPNGGVLLVRDTDRIDPHGVQLIRKRTVSALLAIDALHELERIASRTPSTSIESTSAACDAKLRSLFPEIEHALYFCTGLAAEAAVFSSVGDVLGPTPVTLFFAQNGYGGTGQLITDVLATNGRITPAPLPVFGLDANGRPLTLVDRVIARLEGLEGGPACVFLETPTNPELQPHDFTKLITAVRAYQKRWSVRIPVLVDTTLAPLYPLFAQEFARDWPFILLKSGSKYFTKGKATLGVAASAADPLATEILRRAGALGSDADSFAKTSQLGELHEGLGDLRARMATIDTHTAHLAAGIREALSARGHEITLFSTSQKRAADAPNDLACGLLSFYLPPAPTNHADLVDEFVAHLIAHAPTLVKNRVSYGQSTGDGRADFFYVINPQESTQGSLPEAVKNAQKRGNVQICRISVPEHADVEGLLASMELFFTRKYGAR